MLSIYLLAPRVFVGISLHKPDTNAGGGPVWEPPPPRYLLAAWRILAAARRALAPASSRSLRALLAVPPEAALMAAWYAAEISFAFVIVAPRSFVACCLLPAGLKVEAVMVADLRVCRLVVRPYFLREEVRGRISEGVKRASLI